MRAPLRIGYVGRFDPGWATERDMANALGRLGHAVEQVPERGSHGLDFDLIVWTPSDLGLPTPGLRRVIQDGNVPVVGFHLDRWWGLDRERVLRHSLLMRCALVVTADGGHDGAWAGEGVLHEWLPPAIAAEDLSVGPIGSGDGSVLFVGRSSSYHPEWPHRQQLVGHLREWFGNRFVHIGDGQRARGPALTGLIQRASVVIGDSCLAGGQTRYWSDRIPETLGRGGFLLHPHVEGLELWFMIGLGGHLSTWEAGDWSDLREKLDYFLDDQQAARRQVQAETGREHVRNHHTYDVRAVQLLALCEKHELF